MRRIYFKKIKPQPGDIEGHKEFYGKWLCNIQITDTFGCSGFHKYKIFAFIDAALISIKCYSKGMHKL